jgi:hypothetical protein
MSQAGPDAVSLRWGMAGDSVLHAGYEMVIHSSGSARPISVRQWGEWLLSPGSCDSSLASAGSCAMVLRQVADTVSLSYGSQGSAVTRPALPPSEPMPVRLTAAGDWDVPLDWHIGQRDPVMATSQMDGLIPIRLPARPVSVGSEWPVVTTFDHRTPRKEFVDSFAGSARLDSLTGPAGHQLAWMTLHGTSVGYSSFAGFSLDTTTTEAAVVWDVTGGRPVRVTSSARGVSALRDSTGAYRRVHVSVESRLLMRVDAPQREAGIVP